MLLRVRNEGDINPFYVQSNCSSAYISKKYVNTNYRMGFITAKFSMIGGQRIIICMEDTRICIHAQFKRQNGRLASINAMYEGLN